MQMTDGRRWRLVLVSPDGRAKGLADTEANTDADADDEEDNENLHDDAVALAHVGHRGAAAVLLGFLGLLLPVVLAGPGATIAAAGVGGAASCMRHGLPGLVAGDVVGLHVGIERIALNGEKTRVLADSGAVIGVDRHGRGVGEGCLFGGAEVRTGCGGRLQWEALGILVIDIHGEGFRGKLCVPNGAD